MLIKFQTNPYELFLHKVSGFFPRRDSVPKREFSFNKARSVSTSDHSSGRASPRAISRQFSRQISRQQSRPHSGLLQDGIDGPPPAGSRRQRLTRQITIADDECHPPAALMGKVQETDRLIQTETAETGRVRVMVNSTTYSSNIHFKVSFYFRSIYQSLLGGCFWKNL